MVCMLFVYLEVLDIFGDEVDDYGYFVKNGILDILDEVKWGLDWMLKLYFELDWLIY